MRHYLILLLWLFATSAISGGEEALSENSKAFSNDLKALSENYKDGSDSLVPLLSELHSFDADFSQRLYDLNGELVQQSEGHLKATRPNLLHWQTAAPMEQQIVADGEQIWVYDPDLEQVIVQGYPEEVAKTPAMLLIGHTDQLAEQYQILVSTEASNSDQQTAIYHLLPRDTQNLYTRVTLEVTNGTTTAMILEDSLQQRTEIHFSNVATNQPMEPSDFQFILPEGVDLIKNDG